VLALAALTTRLLTCCHRVAPCPAQAVSCTSLFEATWFLVTCVWSIEAFFAATSLLLRYYRRSSGLEGVESVITRVSTARKRREAAAAAAAVVAGKGKQRAAAAGGKPK
jgi:hypothetical protein